jgi:hypothetical protein
VVLHNITFIFWTTLQVANFSHFANFSLDLAELWTEIARQIFGLENGSKAAMNADIWLLF